MARVTNEQIEVAKNVNLVEFLRQRGYSLEKKGKEFCLKEHDSLCINPNNNCWRWHSQNVGGRNAIDFLKTYENMDFISAVQTLCGEAVKEKLNEVPSYQVLKPKEPIPVVRPPENKIKIELEKVDMEQLQRLLEWVEAKTNGVNAKAAAHSLLTKISSQIEPAISAVNENVSTQNEEMNEKMKLPERNDTHKRAFAYLAKTRCIDPNLISDLMKQGRIYESKDYHNCVFVTYDENKEPVYASMRGTTEKAFKGDVLNSDKSRGFPINNSGETLFVFEAPIDSMSYITLQIMGGNNEWQKDSYLSLGGVSDVALERYLNEHPNIKSIYFELDGDEAGRNAVYGDGVHEGYISKYMNMGYEVGATFPAQGKDWNEELVKVVETIREQEAATVIDEGLEM